MSRQFLEISLVAPEQWLVTPSQNENCCVSGLETVRNYGQILAVHTSVAELKAKLGSVLVVGRSPVPQRQRRLAYQPRARPWLSNPPHPRVLKERRISPNRQAALNRMRCSAPSERIFICTGFPGLHPGLVCRAPLGLPGRWNGSNGNRGCTPGWDAVSRWGCIIGYSAYITRRYSVPRWGNNIPDF